MGWGVVWEISQQPRWVEEGERVASVEVISWAEARKHDLELNGGAKKIKNKIKQHVVITRRRSKVTTIPSWSQAGHLVAMISRLSCTMIVNVV